jgi:protein PhnA
MAVCSLCERDRELVEYVVEPRDEKILICSECREKLEKPEESENYWHCLNDTMWTQEKPLQVVIYRIFSKLGWQDKLDMMYLEADTLEWAKSGEDEEKIEVRDSNGNILNVGDSVTIIKDLPVKGAGFTAKQGTTVKNIKLVADDPTHIKGKVNGVEIFILSKFVKKV